MYCIVKTCLLFIYIFITLRGKAEYHELHIYISNPSKKKAFELLFTPSCALARAILARALSSAAGALLARWSFKGTALPDWSD